MRLEKLNKFMVEGSVMLIVGLLLISYNNYFNNLSYYFNNCYNAYPPTYSNLTGQYNYSSAYYGCEQQQNLAQANAGLYTTFMGSLGWILAILGFLTVAVTIVLKLVLTFQEYAKSARK